MGTAAMAAAGMMGGPAMGAGREKEGFIWATLLHMGRNMWSDVPVPFWGPKANRVTDPKKLTSVCAADHLRFDEDGRPQNFLTEDKVKELCAISNINTFKSKVKNEVVTRAEKAYMLKCMEDLHINDYDQFWRTSKYLVIQVK